MENMEIKDIFTTYWSQATLLLLGLGFLIKRLLDIKSKKLEINHSLFQQNILELVNKFSANYKKVELMWHQIAIYDVIDRKLTAKQLDNIVFPVMNDLDETIQELRMYFDDNQHKYFTDIKQNLLLIHGELSDIYSSVREDLTAIQKANNYSAAKTKVYAENKKILNSISEMIRKSFKS